MTAPLIFAFLSLLTGAGIGYSFGLFQANSRRREEQSQLTARQSGAWSAVATKGARGACLVMMLLLIQFICPFLFRAGTQWWVSIGVLLGLGWTWVRQIALRLKETRA